MLCINHVDAGRLRLCYARLTICCEYAARARGNALRFPLTANYEYAVDVRWILRRELGATMARMLQFGPSICYQYALNMLSILYGITMLLICSEMLYMKCEPAILVL